MYTEDDTYRVLSRDSFDNIVERLSQECGGDRPAFMRKFISVILNGARPDPQKWDHIWTGWTFKEVQEEVIRRKENDNR